MSSAAQTGGTEGERPVPDSGDGVRTDDAPPGSAVSTVVAGEESPAADDAEALWAGDDRPSWSLTQLTQTRVATAWVLLITSLLGFVASADLTIERIQLLIDPTYSPSCSINPVLSCGSVMITEQAKFFGFPNPLLGIAAFAVALTTAVLTVGRVRLPRWYWIGMSVGSALGWLFVHYLIFQSMYRIGALCPYCMVVWSVMPIITVLSISQSMGDGRTAKSIREWLWILLPVWYVVVIAAGTIEFWYYWRTLF